jgi:thiol-disulfide isomerase/thioredoxin
VNRLGPIITVVIAVVLIALIIRYTTDKPGQPTATQPSAPIGAAPAVGGTTLTGQRWNLQDQRGKVVLLDFWATWCPPCVASIPTVKALHDQFKSNADFLLVGVSEDYTKEDLERFLQKRDITWLQIFDAANRKEIARAFGVYSIPTAILIDRQGNYRPVDLESNTVAAEIDKLLKSPA